MDFAGWAAAVLAALAAAWCLPARAGRAAQSAPRLGLSEGEPEVGWLVRFRAVVALLAGAGAAVFVGGSWGWVAALPATVGCWVVLGHVEAPGVRREREAIRRDLPYLVTLLAAALRAGSAPREALEVVASALPGPAGDRLAGVAARLRMGADPVAVWESLGDGPLGPLARTMARSQRTGAPVVASVDRLAEELARSARADVEDRARAVGVKAAVPLGLCFLPAFLLIGIVPLVGGLLGSLELG